MKKTISVLISLLLCVTLVLAVVVLNTRQYLTAKNIEKEVKKISVLDIMNQDIGEKNPIKPTLDAVYSEAEQYGIQKETVDKIMETDTVKTYLGKSAGNIAEYILTGKNQDILSKEDLKKNLGQDIDKIIIEANIDIKKEYKERFIDVVNANVDTIVEKIPSIEDMDISEISTPVKSAQNILSEKTSLSLLFTSFIAIVILFLLQIKEKKWMKYIGISFIIASVLILLLYIMVPAFLSSLTLVTESYMFLLLEKFMVPYAKNYLWTGITFLILGTLFMGIYLFLKNKKRLLL